MGKTGSIEWIKIRNNKSGFRFVKSGNSKYRKVIPKLRFKKGSINWKTLRSEISRSIV